MFVLEAVYGASKALSARTNKFDNNKKCDHEFGNTFEVKLHSYLSGATLGSVHVEYKPNKGYHAFVKELCKLASQKQPYHGSIIHTTSFTPLGCLNLYVDKTLIQGSGKMTKGQKELVRKATNTSVGLMWDACTQEKQIELFVLSYKCAGGYLGYPYPNTLPDMTAISCRVE
jgi:hypothetical protein